MKWKFLLRIFSIAFVIALFSQCKYGVPGPGELPAPDEDSDRPAWAGGQTGENEHNKKPADGTRGGTKDFGDMVVLLRYDNGVPEMLEFEEYAEDGTTVIGSFWVYQPIDASTGLPVELDQYGEVPEGTLLIEVDFGRLDIVRSPESVINQALGEVLLAMSQGDRFTQDFCGRLSIWNGDVLVKTIDSPRESMSIYREIMRNGGGWGDLSALSSSGINSLDLAAASFAAGSDKTGTVLIDEVEYVNAMLKIPGTLYDELEKEYYDYGGFNYSKQAAFGGKMIQFLVWDNIYYPVDENGESSGPVFSVWRIFDDPTLEYFGINPRPQFSSRATGDVAGFTTAADDAVQVLEFVHGDSNIRYLPNYPEGVKTEPVPETTGGTE